MDFPDRTPGDHGRAAGGIPRPVLFGGRSGSMAYLQQRLRRAAVLSGCEDHASQRRDPEARLRAQLGDAGAFQSGPIVIGNTIYVTALHTLHDMRFVFLDNDTKLLFATAYDGDWDAYIDDFATKIPDYLDLIDSAWEGWPGIRPRMRRTISQSTRSRQRAGTSHIRISRWRRFTGSSASARRWTSSSTRLDSRSGMAPDGALIDGIMSVS